MKQGIILLFAVCMSMTAIAHKTDSVGTKARNGKMYILHKVETGDGLYNISKRYNVSLKDIIVENPGSDEVIKLGQIILIPSNMEPVMEEKVVKDFFDGSSLPKTNIDKLEPGNTIEVSTFAKYHKVALGETLYAISKKYNTSVEMIKTLNALESNELSEGQRLLVQDGSAKTETVDKSLEVETDYTKMKEEMAVQKYENLGYDTPVVTQEPKTINGYTVRVEKLVEYNIEKVEEEGTTGVGAASVPNDKNFAKHFNAPIGTVIMVTNPENKNTVFVKVTGNFEMKEGSSEIIKLSESSAKQIEITDKSRVLLSYAR
jgi:LysM repeat protein|tara:strand:- start:23128 stop:24078 length:951 start_codon:yes stop_codon:yes gene_type:complete